MAARGLAEGTVQEGARQGRFAVPAAPFRQARGILRAKTLFGTSAGETKNAGNGEVIPAPTGGHPHLAPEVMRA